jgi:hypothetical protein
MKFITKAIEFIKASFRMPSAEMMALTELEQAKRELLSMQTAKDYSSRMVEYNQDRIRRLTAHIAKSTQVPTLTDVV